MKAANNQITERDTKVLLDVYKYRYLSVSQIQQLYFPSRQTAYRRLRALKGLEYLQSFTVPNIDESIYNLDRKGAEAVAGELGVLVPDLKWHRSIRKPKDYYFMRHFLKVNDFRIVLTLACGDSDIDLMGFIPEYYGEKTDRGGLVKYIKDFVLDIDNQARKIHHTPDAVFALGKNGKAALFFLEVDRGTETLTDPEKGFLKCIDFYLNYWTTEKYHRYEMDFNCEPFRAFRTLIVTTSATRLANMREVVSSLSFTPNLAKRFIWLTTDDQVGAKTVFAPIWRPADVEDGSTYPIG